MAIGAIENGAQDFDRNSWMKYEKSGVTLGMKPPTVLQPSMSRKGMPYDNAVMGSFFSSLKQELTHHVRFADLDEAKYKLFDYIEVFYNRQWLHSSLGYRTPVEQERLASA